MDASYEVKELYVPENKLQLAKTDAESLLTLEINKVLCVQVSHCCSSRTVWSVLSVSRCSWNTHTGYRIHLDKLFPSFLERKRSICVSLFTYQIFILSWIMSGIMLFSLSLPCRKKFTVISSCASPRSVEETMPGISCMRNCF